MRLMRRAVRRANESDNSASEYHNAKFVGPAASALAADRKERARANPSEQMRQVETLLEAWIGAGAVSLDKRLTMLRLAPMRENLGSLASYTFEELMKGLADQDDEVPPFVLKGQMGKNGKWSKAWDGASHVDGRVVTSVACDRTFDMDSSQQSVFAALEKHVERVLRALCPIACQTGCSSH